MNCPTPRKDSIKLTENSRDSLVDAETFNMLEKQANRLNIHYRPLTARPDSGIVNSPRGGDSFLRNFTSVHANMRTLEPVTEKQVGQYLMPTFDALRKRRSSAPDIAADKKVELPPLSSRPGSVSVTARPRPKTRKSVIGKKLTKDENVQLAQNNENKAPALRSVQSISSLSTHSAPDTNFHMGDKPTPRPRSESPSGFVDKNHNVFERLSSPTKRTQTSNSSGSEPSTSMPRRASTPARLYSMGGRRKSVPHETLKLAIANSTGTVSPTKRSPVPGSHTSNEIENERISGSEASSPKSAVQGRYGQQENYETNEQENSATGKTNLAQTQGSADIDEETNTRIIQWLLGVENGSKIIPESVIEDDETTETAIRIIYPGD